ncbi:winged helix-turn-helix transcriptional regulator [Methanogenium organophilum]|uniref:winged helix-turn-helix transcriptional regulator n=1 Tax=Methanogenium organophilum TaxID=2199 RepID=UPI002DD42AB4|nr:helix-turn-helix domain-containing protein [Methanogenium organophilum]
MTKKWVLLVLFEFYKGDDYTRRFSELKGAPDGITAKVLSQRLRELEEEGLVGKQVDAETFPVQSEYFLTESGAWADGRDQASQTVGAHR